VNRLDADTGARDGGGGGANAGPIDLAYTERGRGAPVVLIMGLGADRSAWEPHLQAYEQRYRCFAADNRGVGMSATPPGPYSTAQMADDYARLIERRAPGPVRVVGISMGGAIAQELALRHPALVERLVLVSTWARCDAYTAEVFSHFARVRAAVSPADFAALLQLWIWTPRYVNERLVELIEARGAGAEAPQPQHAFEAQCEACISHDTAARLGAITVPTLITAGRADIFTPLPLAEDLCAQIPGATLEVFPDAAHAHHWEALDAFNRLTTEWLA
jgi:pimeloyl-ACP methyl ester carboxylesterase